MTQMTGSALIVGSVPLATQRSAVFRARSHALGPYLYGYPDGEVGARRFWIFYLASNTYAGHPDLENVAVPDSGNVTQPARGESEDEINEHLVAVPAARGRRGIGVRQFALCGARERLVRLFTNCDATG